MNFSSVQSGNRLLPIRLTLARSDKFGKKNSKSIEKCTSIRIVCPTFFSLYFRKFYMKNSYRRYCSGHRRRFGYRRRRRRQNDLCQSRNHRSFGHPDGPRLSHSTADDAHVRRLQRQRKKTTTCNRISQLPVTSTPKKRRGLLPKAGFADRYSVYGTDVDGAVQTCAAGSKKSVF